MDKLTQLFAAEFSKKEAVFAPKELKKRSTEKSVQLPTLFQLNATPFVIDTQEYDNAQSSANPAGDYKAAYRFSLLADALPLLSPMYLNSLNSLSKTWGRLLQAAQSDNPFTNSLIEELRTTFKLAKLSGFGGIPEDWYNVVASPSQWCQLLEEESQLIPLEIDLTGGATEQNDFLVLNGTTGNNWKFSSVATKEETALQASSQITKIKMNVLRVDFYRPWFSYELFSQSWKILGLDKGYYSTGTLTNNNGVLPLIPQSFLVGKAITIEGNLSATDQAIVAQAQQNKTALSLGNFSLQEPQAPLQMRTENGKTTLSSTSSQIVGYISRLVPTAPAQAALVSIANNIS